MKFNYKLRRLCGASYGNPTTTSSGTGPSSGSNVVYTSDGNSLVSPVSNRIQIVDLVTHAVRTMPFETRSNVKCVGLSPPDDRLLLAIDVNDYAVLANYRRGVVLHRFRFKKKVRCVEFSPNGRYFAVSAGKHVEVWHTPGLRREFAPFVRHRTYGGLTEDVVSISWSSDGSVLMGCSRDSTARVWTVHTTLGFEPTTLGGMKGAVVGGYFEDEEGGAGRIGRAYTVSEDGALVTWGVDYPDDDGDEDDEDDDGVAGDAAVDFFSGGPLPPRKKKRRTEGSSPPKDQAHHLVGAKFVVRSRHYFHQDRASVTTTSHSARHGLLVVGFSTGLFALYELPSVSVVHTLSVGSSQPIRAASINDTGEWLAFGCPRTQQLLVWEWRSETYVVKQRGHACGMRCVAYAPDSIVAATGGEDGNVKLWNVNSGFCYVTLRGHTAPVTAVSFSPSSSAVVLSSSLDGTVRAHDLHRYRNFKTLTAPIPVQFLCLAVDPSGEIVAAGTADPFRIYVWNLQSGKVIETLAGHGGPVSALAFHPSRGTLASSSWDGQVKVWDLYKKDAATDSLGHSADVVCLAFRPDGAELCAGTIRGVLSFWNTEDMSLKGELDGRRDIAGGRKLNDRMTADNNASSRYFTSVCYSADGSCVLAGGNSKYVCIYQVSKRMLLKKFQISFNRSLDGVLDELNTKNIGDGGPVDENDDSGDETEYNALRLPGAKRSDDGSRKSRVEVLTSQVTFSSTGREWAAVSGEGLHVYSLDDDMIFDPISLTENVTPGAVQSNLRSGEYGTALLMSLHLNEFGLVREVLEGTPFGSIPHVVRSVGPEHLERLLQFVSKVMADSPHVEFYLQWCLELLQTHGTHVEKHRGSYMRAIRAMHKTVSSRHEELKTICDENRYTLDFVEDQARLVQSDAI